MPRLERSWLSIGRRGAQPGERGCSMRSSRARRECPHQERTAGEDGFHIGVHVLHPRAARMAAVRSHRPHHFPGHMNLGRVGTARTPLPDDRRFCASSRPCRLPHRPSPRHRALYKSPPSGNTLGATAISGRSTCRAMTVRCVGTKTPSGRPRRPTSRTTSPSLSEAAAG